MAEWGIGYPVNYTENGDETKIAVSKFMQEFEKVYAHLNTLQQKIEELKSAEGED
ncbi:hypothetical protein FACS1894204_06160 [Synergistales bacterium]|nr:hypothetical protein FACS1894204_06160 [Synergistales bacterium]